MSATAQAPAKKKLSLAMAAEQYRASKLAIDGLTPLMEEAKAVLVDYFERTEKPSYKRIGWKWSGGQLILNQAMVRELLGEKLRQYQTRARRSRSLTLL